MIIIIQNLRRNGAKNFLNLKTIIFHQYVNLETEFHLKWKQAQKDKNSQIDLYVFEDKMTKY